MARPIKILSHRIVTSPSEVPEIYTRVGFRLENEHPPRTPELAPRDRLGSERPVPCPARAPRSARGRSRRCPCAENHRTEGMGRATPPRPASGRPVGDPRQLRLRVVPPEVRRDELAAARPRGPGPHEKDAPGRESDEPLPPSVLGPIGRPRQRGVLHGERAPDARPLRLPEGSSDRGRDRLARPPPEEGRRMALLPLPYRDAGLLGSPRRFCRAPFQGEDPAGPPGHRARRGVLPPAPSVPRRAHPIPSLVSAPLSGPLLLRHPRRPRRAHVPGVRQ